MLTFGFNAAKAHTKLLKRTMSCKTGQQNYQLALARQVLKEGRHSKKFECFLNETREELVDFNEHQKLVLYAAAHKDESILLAQKVVDKHSDHISVLNNKLVPYLATVFETGITSFSLEDAVLDKAVRALYHRELASGPFCHNTLILWAEENNQASVLMALNSQSDTKQLTQETQKLLDTLITRRSKDDPILAALSELKEKTKNYHYKPSI